MDEGVVGGGFDTGAIFGPVKVMVGSTCIIAISSPAQPSCPTCQTFL